MRILVILFVFGFLITGCNRNKYIIPEKTFKNILIDLHLADGIYMMNWGKYENHTDSLNFYNTVLKNYGYNRAQFDSTLKYYVTNLKEFDKMYEGVVNQLHVLEGQILKVREFESNYMENLFPMKKKWNIPTDGKYSRIPFDIPIKDSAEFSIYVYAKKYPDDQTKNPRITAYFTYFDRISKKQVVENFPEVKYNANNKYHNLYSTTKVYNFKKEGRLRGWILNQDEINEPLNKHFDIKIIYIEKKLLKKQK